MNQKELKNILEYIPETGEFFWKVDKGRKRAGESAGCTDKRFGYVLIKLNQKLYLAHRLVFLYMEGSIPKLVDHIDCNPSNNKWNNLRKATACENQYNKCLARNNKSTVKGVSWHKASKKWRAYITVDKKRNELGYFISLEEAAEKVSKARKELHKHFHKEW